MHACGQAGTVPPRGLAEPLTGRELAVLRLLAAGWSNQCIARDPVVALDMVEPHVTHILGKLGAANRTEAAARARQLGLIPDSVPSRPVAPSGDGFAAPRYSTRPTPSGDASRRRQSVPFPKEPGQLGRADRHRPPGMGG